MSQLLPKNMYIPKKHWNRTRDRERNRGVEVLSCRKEKQAHNWQWRCQGWGNFPNVSNKFVRGDAQKCKIIRVPKTKKSGVKWQELLIKMSYLIKLWIIQKGTFSSSFYANLTLEMGRAHGTGAQAGAFGKNQPCNTGWAQTGCHFTPVPLLQSITKFSASDFYIARVQREAEHLCVLTTMKAFKFFFYFLLSDPAQLFTKDLGDSKSHLINWVS